MKREYKPAVLLPQDPVTLEEDPAQHGFILTISVRLLVHRCLQAHADYTYNRNDMLVDTDWIDALGPILAPWAGC